MKKIISALILSTTLSGCALYDIYMMAGYDTNEYALITKVRTISISHSDSASVSQSLLSAYTKSNDPAAAPGPRTRRP